MKFSIGVAALFIVVLFIALVYWAIKLSLDGPPLILR